MNYIISGSDSNKTGIGLYTRSLISGLPRKKFKKLIVNYDFSGYRQRLRATPVAAFYEILKFCFFYPIIRFKLLSFVFLRSNDKVVLIHPQSIGFFYINLMLKYRKKNLYIILVDNSFFCIKSYNYIDGEKSGCLRCIESDAYATKYNCKPFPVNSDGALEFIKNFKKSLKRNHLEIFTISNFHANFLKKHYHISNQIRVIGMWYEYFDDCYNINDKNNFPSYDVVFNASYDSAKGAYWCIQLAKASPSLTFFFPFDSPEGLTLPNCTFKNINWNSGLKEIVANSKLTLLPTFWTTPVEGAFIQSLIFSKQVAVMDSEYSFSSYEDVPGLLALPFSIKEASDMILTSTKSIIDNRNNELLTKWLKNFRVENISISDKLLKYLEA